MAGALGPSESERTPSRASLRAQHAPASSQLIAQDWSPCANLCQTVYLRRLYGSLVVKPSELRELARTTLLTHTRLALLRLAGALRLRLCCCGGLRLCRQCLRLRLRCLSNPTPNFCIGDFLKFAQTHWPRPAELPSSGCCRCGRGTHACAAYCSSPANPP